MIWKKLLLELVAFSGLGGGIGGWFSHSGGGIQVEEDKDSLLFKTKSSLQVKQAVSKDINKKAGLVQDLNYTALGSHRWKSEGVNEDILFVGGWRRAGKHKVIESKKHSQAERELWGGKKVTHSNSWFGPRRNSAILDDLEKAKEKSSQSEKSYWEKIQEAGKFIEDKDVEGIQKVWTKRNKELEEDIFGLYNGRDWWVKNFGTTGSQKLVDLTINIVGLKKMLGKTEEQLKTESWNYGQLFNNPNLKLVRLLGNVEDVGFNYLKKYLWGEESKLRGLAEKNIFKIIVDLITGEGEVGYKCDSSESRNEKAFPECAASQSLGEGVKLKNVIKSALVHNGKLTASIKGERDGWPNMAKLESNEEKTIVNESQIEKSPIIIEGCEKEVSWLYVWSAPGNQLRRKICQEIMDPWFNHQVNDKRLCLFEVKDYSYLIRFQTYLKIIQIPAWMNKNTFWTKCSNYGI
ncbi:hypothetical protein WEN_01225 [Mycoplasma wenyonii str. Massachusetts]|uniref:Uncharacterized protein n=1 Tax=Mycoplasma wenyonii (strain Massachusetts) TaxID=1197325 RepID=I6YL92_MYCWM|nr:hypothetical protein [Mycoplasma wenyonii]AFN65044.1 hypothetical protein WEN_01225 [Mycoplasma wenyonii str. Massachusetts]